MRLGLVAVVILVLTGCASSHQTVAAPKPVLKPRLPTRAGPNNVASFRCPRHPGTTLDLEACAGHEQLALNAQFDKAVTALWPMLDKTGRREFARGQLAWNHYVAEQCDVQAREYLGGTEAPVEADYCGVAPTRVRVKEVTGTLALYCQGKVRTGPYRRCPRQ
jgi:uncharacterized protein YecT (DUF1311 family)